MFGPLSSTPRLAAYWQRGSPSGSLRHGALDKQLDRRPNHGVGDERWHGQDIGALICGPNSFELYGVGAAFVTRTNVEITSMPKGCEGSEIQSEETLGASCVKSAASVYADSSNQCPNLVLALNAELPRHRNRYCCEILFHAQPRVSQVTITSLAKSRTANNQFAPSEMVPNRMQWSIGLLRHPECTTCPTPPCPLRARQ